jgi:single-stranded DNA-binding protein
MHSQIYLTGKLHADPELVQTKKGRLWVKILLQSELTRENRPGEFVTESVILPVSLFSTPAEQVKNLKRGDSLTIGAHLYGTRFDGQDGPKYGVQLVGDVAFLTARSQ